MGGYPSVLVGSVSVCHFKINEQIYSRPRLRESTYHLGCDSSDSSDNLVELMGIEVSWVTIINLYDKPNNILSINKLNALSKYKKTSNLIAGDFNAHHPIWAALTTTGVALS